jgi:hypothetical protein
MTNILLCGWDVQDGKSSDPGWIKVGSEVWDKHPVSATMLGKALQYSTYNTERSKTKIFC